MCKIFVSPSGAGSHKHWDAGEKSPGSAKINITNGAQDLKLKAATTVLLMDTEF
jgi:hypothetical protein